jgi:hypothetical protein
VRCDRRCTESGPFRVLGNLRPAFPRSHMRRKSLIGGTAGPFFGRAGTSLTGRQHPEWTALTLNDTGRESATTTAALAKSADAITGQGPRSMQRGQFP